MAASLSEQSARAVLAALAAGSQDLIERLTKFEPEDQRLILRHMGNEIAGLRVKEEELRLIKSIMPTTDLRIYTIGSSEDPESTTKDEDMLRRDGFLSKWQKIQPDTMRESLLMKHQRELMNDVASAPTYRIQWTDSDLLADSPFAPLVLQSLPRIGKIAHGCEALTRMSPQLLLYRICALFDMPPAQYWSNADYCWKVCVQYIPRTQEVNFLEFTEFVGGVIFKFRGQSDEASQAAIDLVNALFQPENYHRWHFDLNYRFIAGRSL